jgi:hypothetical protein
MELVHCHLRIMVRECWARFTWKKGFVSFYFCNIFAALKYVIHKIALCYVQSAQPLAAARVLATSAQHASPDTLPMVHPQGQSCALVSEITLALSIARLW